MIQSRRVWRTAKDVWVAYIFLVFAAVVVLGYVLRIRLNHKCCRAFFAEESPTASERLHVSSLFVVEGAEEGAQALTLFGKQARKAGLTCTLSSDEQRLYCCSRVLTDLPIALYVKKVGVGRVEIQAVDQYRQPIMIEWMRRRFQNKIDRMVPSIVRAIKKPELGS